MPNRQCPLRPTPETEETPLDALTPVTQGDEELDDEQLEAVTQHDEELDDEQLEAVTHSMTKNWKRRAARGGHPA